MFKVINKEFFESKMLPEKGKAIINLKNAVSNPRPVQFLTAVTTEDPLEFKGEVDLTVFVDTAKDRQSFSIRNPHPTHGKARNLYLVAVPYSGVIDHVAVPKGAIVRKAFVARRQGLEPIVYNKKMFSSVLYMLIETDTPNEYALTWKVYQKSQKKLLATPYTLRLCTQCGFEHVEIGTPQVINLYHTNVPLTEDGFVDLKAIRAGKTMIEAKYDDLILVVNNNSKNAATEKAVAPKQTRNQPTYQKKETFQARGNSEFANKINNANQGGPKSNHDRRNNGKQNQSSGNQAKKQYTDRGFGKPYANERPKKKNYK